MLRRKLGAAKRTVEEEKNSQDNLSIAAYSEREKESLKHTNIATHIQTCIMYIKKNFSSKSHPNKSLISAVLCSSREGFKRWPIFSKVS